MKTLSLLSLMAAVVCFTIGAFVPPAYPHTQRLIAAGLAFFAASFLLLSVPS